MGALEGFRFTADQSAGGEDAKAVILSPQLVTGRTIQLTPPYTGGPTMADGAVHIVSGRPAYENFSLWDTIRIDPMAMRIVDAPAFQRLRHIRQLGLAYLVYPGATHRVSGEGREIHMWRTIERFLQRNVLDPR